MPRTQGRYDQDLGYSDGIILLGPNDAIATGGASTLTRNAAGDLSHNAGASVSPIYSFPLSKGCLFRTGVKDDVQEQFGGTIGPAGVTGRPPFAGISQLTPLSAFRLKGLKILNFKVIYLISTNPLSSHTCRMDKTVFANNVANAITPILASAANGLATAAQANPYVTTVTLAAAQQIYRISDLSEYVIEVAPTTPVGGAYRMYGVQVGVEFNFN